MFRWLLYVVGSPESGDEARGDGNVATMTMEAVGGGIPEGYGIRDQEEVARLRSLM